MLDARLVRPERAAQPADVLLGVATLSPDYLIEVDAIAVID